MAYILLSKSQRIKAMIFIKTHDISLLTEFPSIWWDLHLVSMVPTVARLRTDKNELYLKISNLKKICYISVSKNRRKGEEDRTEI